MYTIVIQTEEQIQQFTEIEKEEAIVITVSQMEIKQFREELVVFKYTIKREDRDIERTEVELVDRERKLLQR